MCDKMERAARGITLCVRSSEARRRRAFHWRAVPWGRARETAGCLVESWPCARCSARASSGCEGPSPSKSAEGAMAAKLPGVASERAKRGAKRPSGGAGGHGPGRTEGAKRRAGRLGPPGRGSTGAGPRGGGPGVAGGGLPPRSLWFLFIYGSLFCFPAAALFKSSTMLARRAARGCGAAAPRCARDGEQRRQGGRVAGSNAAQTRPPQPEARAWVLAARHHACGRRFVPGAGRCASAGDFPRASPRPVAAGARAWRAARFQAGAAGAGAPR